jgi:hypothetical protein
MGLLDDLKKQAEQVKTQQLSESALREEAIKLVEAKMKQTFAYLNELLKQLAVLKPVNPLVFSMPGVADLKDLKFAESFIDYRKTRIGDVEYFEQIPFYIRWTGDANIVLDRDMPATAQKVRDAFYGGGIKFDEEQVRNARMAAAGWRFTAKPVVVTDVVIRADHAKGELRINAKNLLRLGVDDFLVPAGDVTEAWLEDFAVTLLGQPGNLRKYRAVAPLR